MRPISRRKLEQSLLTHKGTWLGGMLRYDSYPDGEGISVSSSVLPRLLPGGVRYTGRIHEQPAGDAPCGGPSLPENSTNFAKLPEENQ